jgi:hypothetical protein
LGIVNISMSQVGDDAIKTASLGISAT